MARPLQNVEPRQWLFRPTDSMASIAREVQSLANHVSVLLRQLLALQILDGRIVADVEFTASTATRVLHGLGREPRGWLVVRFIAASHGALREDSGTPPDASALTLTSDVDATVTLLVF